MPYRTSKLSLALRHWAVTLAAVLVLLFLLAACGSDSPTETPVRDRPTPEATDPPAQEAASPTPGERPATPPPTAVPTSTPPPPTPSITSPQETPPPPPGPVATASAPVAPEVDEREDLAAFYNATGGEGWVVSDNWLSDQPVSQWYGVITGVDGRVE